MQLHALNRGFCWKPPRGKPRRLRDDQVAAFDTAGGFVLEDAFDAAVLQRAIAEIDPWEARVTAFLRTLEGGKLFIADADAITFTTHLVTRSDWLRAFCAGPVFQDLCHDLVGDDVRLYWDQAVYKKPGKPQSFPWHQDNGYTFIEPQQYLTCWVALTDATVENGCPWIVPGIHRSGTLAHWPTDLGHQCLEAPDGAVPLPARAGSIVVFSSLTPHATGPNTTDQVRKAYIVQFAPEGARVIAEEPGTGARRETLQDAADRQFPVLLAGRGID